MPLESTLENRAAAPTLGVVIPVYNRRQILPHTLERVVAQTGPPDCLVIADDGSTDGSAHVAQAFLAKRAPRFRWSVLRLPHTTAARARNAGLEQVQDLDFVAFLDSDDFWPVDFLSRAVANLQRHPQAVAAVADRRYEPAGAERQMTDCRPLAHDPILWMFRHGAGIASCSVFRTATVRALGGWPAELGTAEDADLFCRVALQGPWVHLPGDPVVFHVNARDRTRQDEINLSRRHADSHARWAAVYESTYHFVAQSQPHRHASALRKALARRWSSAGKQYLSRGCVADARRCMIRALQWYPTDLKNWRRLARLALASLPWPRSGQAA